MLKKCTFYNKKVETNSISFFFCYEYKVSCKYVQSFELVLYSRKHFTDETHSTHYQGSRCPPLMEVLNEMPRLKDHLSVTVSNTCGPRDKNFSKHSFRSALGDREREHDSKDSKQHIKHSSRRLAKVLRHGSSWAVQTRKHLG